MAPFQLFLHCRLCYRGDTGKLHVKCFLTSCPVTLACRRGPRTSARGGRQGTNDLKWDGHKRFLTYANTDLQLFQDVYCHIILEWCWTTIQGTPVSLLSAFETKEPAPSALVPPSQGWAPDPAPPVDPSLSLCIAQFFMETQLKVDWSDFGPFVINPFRVPKWPNLKQGQILSELSSAIAAWILPTASKKNYYHRLSPDPTGTHEWFHHDLEVLLLWVGT